MVGHEERQRLIQAHAAEQVSVKSVIAISSACLMLLAGIAAMGAFSGETMQAQSGGARLVQGQQGAR